MEHFDPEFLRRLERLAIVARKTLRGVGRGERRSKRHGGTVEFADYRRYAPGDDTRQIDWYAYARLEQMFLKLYMEEQDLSLHLLVDQSASMGAGEPPKLPYARRVAAALAYVGMAAGDQVSVRCCRGGERTRPLGPYRGRAQLVRLLQALEQDDQARGETSLAGVARTFVAQRPAPGVVVVISDLLDPAGYAEPLERLRYTGHEVHLVHVVAPDEAEPEVGQDVDLVDAETGEVAGVSLDQAAVREYRAAFQAYVDGVRAFCRKHEIGHVLPRTDHPFEELVLDALRRGALVR